ncbi:MAG: family 20 glycosylhydrolase [Planctomycetes bacterium]|nr:family 20 glycosylhydrolase [Planctomycetota bacterium]
MKDKMPDKKTARPFNGVMIDCSRLMEQHDYYFRLLDFMADWSMNTLLLHFADDHGLGLQLPGFKDIAMPESFTVQEVKRLIAHAEKLGIDIIPEVETFGHTRYLTGQNKYRHLGASEAKQGFNAVDPLNPETHKLMRRLLRETAKLFPSRYLHIGGDEVNLGDYCKIRGIENADALWAGYVNTVLGYARDEGKQPMFWADHAWNNPRIASLLDKDALALWWQYTRKLPMQTLRALKKAGFNQLVGAPSVACWEYRFGSGRIALENNQAMARTVSRAKLLGSINTVWCPFRYFQGAIYYGLAFGAAQTAAGGRMTMREFNERFVVKTFGIKPTAALMKYLKHWPDVQVRYWFTDKLLHGNTDFGEGEVAEMSKVQTVWRILRDLDPDIQPVKNADIWTAMRLAADAAGLCSEYFELSRDNAAHPERKQDYNRLLRKVRREAGELWDQTRFADDPQKKKPKFHHEGHAFALVVLKCLPLL